MALVVPCLCAFTTAVDITITNVALAFISADLKASTGDLQWVNHGPEPSRPINTSIAATFPA